MTNSGFVDGIATDGMRRHLARDFDAIYVLDLGGNVRKNPKLSGTTHNVFGIQVGVCVTFLVKRRTAPSIPAGTPRDATIYYAAVDGDWRRDEKYRFLKAKGDITTIDWQIVNPSRDHTWLTEGMDDSYDQMLRIFSDGSGQYGVFRRATNGLKTNRDQWVVGFHKETLASNVQTSIEFYNYELHRWISRSDKSANVDDFVRYDVSKISWSRDLKADLKRGRVATFDPAAIRRCLYRPFTARFVYLDRLLNEEVYGIPSLFPIRAPEGENRAICVTDVGSRSPFSVLMTDSVPDIHLCASTDTFQCFAFYTYSEDGSERRENIPDATQVTFWRHYDDDETISKWDIFHYVYALLHHPIYRTRFSGNLRRELPRLPFAPDFKAFADAGRMLADLHVQYELQPEFPLRIIEDRTKPLNWRVERMRLSADRKSICYNEFFTLEGVPPAALDYRLGNRSALEWVLEQHQVSVDARSGLMTDPNQPDDEGRLMRLIRKVITVSLETQKIVASLPTDLGAGRFVALQ